MKTGSHSLRMHSDNFLCLSEVPLGLEKLSGDNNIKIWCRSDED